MQRPSYTIALAAFPRLGARIVRTRHRAWPTFLACCLGAACGPPSPGPRVQRALNHYAPDLALGERVGAAARARYHLKIEPYLGYRDSTFQAGDEPTRARSFAR